MKPGEIDEDNSEMFLNRIEHLYYEHLAGKELSPKNLSEDDWNGLVAFVRAEKQKQRELTVNLESLLSMVRSQFQPR